MNENKTLKNVIETRLKWIRANEGTIYLSLASLTLFLLFYPFNSVFGFCLLVLLAVCAFISHKSEPQEFLKIKEKTTIKNSDRAAVKKIYEKENGIFQRIKEVTAPLSLFLALLLPITAAVFYFFFHRTDLASIILALETAGLGALAGLYYKYSQNSKLLRELLEYLQEKEAPQKREAQKITAD